MRQALLIFRKDVRRFRLPAAALLSLIAIFGWMEAVLPHRREFQAFPFFFEILLLIAAWFLIVTTVHQEVLPGDRQYWITRPIPWSSLIIAKMLFAAVFFNLPVLVCNVAALLANGLSPFDYAASLLARQVFVLAFLVLPAMALASVTRNLGQFVIAAFAGFGVVLVIGLQFSPFPGIAAPSANWGGFTWIRTSATALLAGIACCAVLWLQYKNRRTQLSRTILILAVLLLAVAPAFNLWHAAFRLQAGASHRTPQSDTIRLSLDPHRDLAPGRDVLGFWRGAETYMRIVLPVELRGLPAGMQVLSERIAVVVDAPDGVSWSGPWSDAGGTLRLTGEQRLLPEDGAYWQYFYIDRALYERLKNTPVHLRTSAAFTLLSPATTRRLTPPTLASFVPQFGFCATRAIAGGISNAINGLASVVCLAPLQSPEWGALYVQSRRTGRTESFGTQIGRTRSLWREALTYSPYPVGLGTSVWAMLGDAKPVYDAEALDILLEERHAVAYMERNLDLQGVHLSQYQDAPTGASR